MANVAGGNKKHPLHSQIFLIHSRRNFC